MGAVHIAAVLGVEAAISLLEIHGADLNTQDDRGATPLLLAVSQGHKQVHKHILTFLKKSKDINPFIWKGSLITLFWSSGDVCLGFQKQSGSPHLHTIECDTCRRLGSQHGRLIPFPTC